MSQLTQALSAAATRNHELLSILSQTDDAESDLAHNKTYISELKAQIQKTNLELARLRNVTEDERKDHLKSRDSTLKRLTHILTSLKSKSRRTSSAADDHEFLSAWHHEREAESTLSSLTSTLKSAESATSSLESATSQHEAAQHELDILYASIFTSPHAAIPGESAAELALSNAQATFKASRHTLASERAALASLRSAADQFAAAVRELGKAYSASLWDIEGGGKVAVVVEWETLSHAQTAVTQGMRYVEEAKKAQPEVSGVSAVHVVEGPHRSDQGEHHHHLGKVRETVLDGFFADLGQHDRIKESEAQACVVRNEVQREMELQGAREKRAREEVKSAMQGLEFARGELQAVRAKAFEKVLGPGGAETEPPPVYTV